MRKYAITLILFLATLLYSTSSAFSAANDGFPCNMDTDCNSGYCRTDYDGGKYCAEDNKHCVHWVAGPAAAQYNDGSISGDYKCDSGTWDFQDSDNDGVPNADDSCPGTPAGCTVGNGMISAATGCPFEPVSGYYIKAGVVESCPGSSIPVDPEKSACLETGIANALSILFFLKTGATEYGVNALGECKLQDGTEGWHDITDGRLYCEFEIPPTIAPGSYDLLARYTINGNNYQKVFYSGFTVLNTCSVSSICSHGGHIPSATTLNPGIITFDSPFTTDAGVYVTCEGAKGTISGVSQYVSQCSDGATGAIVNPGLLAWVYDSSNPGLTLGYDDNRFQGGTFVSVPTHRNILFNSPVGHRWTSNLGWRAGAPTNIIDDFYTFNVAGNYRVYVDNIDNICDSPDYICPNVGTLCDIGTLDTEGFAALTDYDVNIINPNADLSSNPATDIYYVSDPYNPSIRKSHDWSIINNGTGKLNISNISVTCPPELACSSSPTDDAVVDGGATEININTIFTLPCEYSVTDYPITLAFNTADYYGLECSPLKTETFTTTIVQGNVSDDSLASCECYSGKNNLWDDIRGCCDQADCWLSGDMTWICDNGNRIDGTIFCDVERACGDVWYWNKSMWAEKLPNGCRCDDSTDCGSGECITGICLDIVNPNVSFTSGSFAIELGSKVQTVLSVRNNIAVEDTLKMTIHTYPAKMQLWAKFSNGENEIDVSMSPYEEKLIPIEVFAGGTGNYKVTIYGTSELVPTLYGKDEQTIMVVAKERGITSRTPGLQLFSLITLLLIAGFLAFRKRKN